MRMSNLQQIHMNSKLEMMQMLMMTTSRHPRDQQEHDAEVCTVISRFKQANASALSVGLINGCAYSLF